MVDIADVSKITVLYQEMAQIQQALHLFESGNKITMLGLAAPRAEGQEFDPPPILISVGRLEYPPQMVDAIKTGLADRQQEILSELSDLGITGTNDRRR